LIGQHERDGKRADRSADVWPPMELIAQIALGVIIGGLTIALVVIGFFVWNSRQKNERLAVGLFIAAAVIIAVLVAVVVSP
jgi:hypothetical protein